MTRGFLEGGNKRGVWKLSRVHSAGDLKLVGCDRRGKLLVRDSLTGVKPAANSVSLT